MGKQTEAQVRNTFNDEDDDDEANALAMLSPEERAAMEDEDEAAALKKVAADDEGEDDADEDDGKAKAEADDEADDDSDDEEDGDDADAADDSKGKAEEAGKADEADPDTTEADASAAEEQAAAVVEPVAPLDLAPLQAAHDAKLRELAEERKVAFKKYNDGDMSPEDFAAADEKYLNARDAARDELQANTAWFKEVHAFKGDVSKEVNYDKDSEKAGSWDDWVKRLASKPEHADKPARWFLEEAHRKVKVEYGIAEAAPAKATKAEKAEPAKVVKPVKKAPDLTKIPKTLGGLPAAAEEAADGDSGEFAHLEGLTGMALERALAKLTPEQEARYLMG
jgi:hypothetical protein